MVNYTNYSLYNTSAIEDAHGIGGFVGGANDLTGGGLGAFLLLITFIMGYAGTKRLTPNDEVGVAIGLTTASMFGVLLWGAQWLDWSVAFIPVILLIIFVVYKSLSSGGP